jgi:prepilin peptidase CpaA
VIPHWLYLLFLVELVVVSWLDFKTKKILNIWTYLNLALAFTLIALNFSEPWSYQQMFYPLIVFIAGFFLFIVKIMGAGDVKFLSSFLLCLPYNTQLIFGNQLLLSTIIVAGILLIVNFSRHLTLISSQLKIGNYKGIIQQCFGTKFSYAPVMLLAWIFAAKELGVF